MTEREFQAKLAELDRLLNDPEVRMDPDRVWTLLADSTTRILTNFPRNTGRALDHPGCRAEAEQATPQQVRTAWRRPATRPSPRR